MIFRTTKAIITHTGQNFNDNIDFTTMPGNYSLSEIDTGYTWIDGKHIYKKTISIGTLPNNSVKNVAHGISNLNYIISLEGIAVSSLYLLPMNFPALDNSLVIRTFADYSNVTVGTGVDRSDYTGYVTLYYTKSS